MMCLLLQCVNIMPVLAQLEAILVFFSSRKEEWCDAG